MPSIEDRIAALERKVAALELRRMYDEKKAEEATPAAQTYNLRELNENITILLGVASNQGGDIKTIKEDMNSIKDCLERLETKFDEQTALLTQILARLPEKPQH
jgi:seryl-tRNA synthetase